MQGGSAADAAAQIVGHGGMDISAGGDVRIAGGSGSGAFARIYGYSDINITVGGFLKLNAGSGEGAWARIQTPTRDQVINLHFSNLPSGGYFVNGIEGEVRDGNDGLYFRHWRRRARTSAHHDLRSAIRAVRRHSSGAAATSMAMAPAGGSRAASWLSSSVAGM